MPVAGGFGGTQVIEITSNAILMPIFSVNRAHTALTVADGATVLIGGLLQEQVTTVEDKVPVFGDIPLIGRFFQSRSSEPSRKVIMFFVTVNLVDPAGKPFNH
jgi:general secretion pathway protein D